MAPVISESSHEWRILGLIPARGGSKGVPRKNIKRLAGRPLLHYTASAALAVDHRLERKRFTAVPDQAREPAHQPTLADINSSARAQSSGVSMLSHGRSSTGYPTRWSPYRLF